jgi:hypothetical protein
VSTRESYKGRKLEAKRGDTRHPLQTQTLVNGHPLGHVTGTGPDAERKAIEQLRRNIDAVDERNVTDPNAYPAYMQAGGKPVRIA